MALYGAGAEYALHCVLLLGAGPEGIKASGRSLADFQGVSRSYVAKLFTRLEKAGVLVAEEGLRGGYRLARPLAEISVLEIVDAVEGRKPFFKCTNVREDCALFDGEAPAWARRGTCAIHAAMLEAESAARATLAATSMAAIDERFSAATPERFKRDTILWFSAVSGVDT